MNVATSNNAPPSATTSSNELNNRLDEADFLARENEQAKAAMARMLEEMKQSVQTAADIRLWTRQHPWMAMGAAAAAGFVAATTIVPTKNPSHSKGAANGYAPVGPHPQAPFPGVSHGSQRSAMMTSLLAPLFEMAKVAVQSSIASAIGAAMQTSAADVADARQDPAPTEPSAHEYTPSL